MPETYDPIAARFNVTRAHLWPDLLTFRTYIPPGPLHVLDVGCGNGRQIELFDQSAITYLGVDLSPEQIKTAQARYPHQTFRVGDIQQLDIADQQYDVVTAVAVLHHLPTPAARRQGLLECYRVLKPGGRLFLTNWRLWQRRYVKYFWRAVWQPGHWRDLTIPFKDEHGRILTNRYYYAFTFSELQKLCRASGFRVAYAHRGTRNYLMVLQK